MQITQARMRMWGFSAFVVLGLGGCGLESCAGFGNFEPTPEPEAEITGVVDELPTDLANRVNGAELRVQAVSVDGAVLAEGLTRVGERFRLLLGPGLDHFNVRLVARGGSMVLKSFAPEAAAGDVVDVGSLGLRSTAAAQIAERYAVRERRNLASTPTGTLTEVLANADSEQDDVAAFRSLVETILNATDPVTGEPAFEITGSAADGAALGQSGVAEASYAAALEAAVDASLVPVVCDPSLIRVMFTVDASGQAKDGNGAAQFIRQPTKEGKIFLGITLDPNSPVPDSARTLRPRLTPNDAQTEMFDDGTRGDEVEGDGVFTRLLDLPRGMRVLYKYTNGSAGEGFTGTEEWPGNARILQVEDALTGTQSGAPDCLVIRRDSFGDESSNKNFVNLHARLGGGDLGYEDDLGGPQAVNANAENALPVGGLALGDIQANATLTPAGIPEARENGMCENCPAPITVSADDASAPRVIAASFLSTDRTRVVFSEDVDVQSGGRPSNYLLIDADNNAIQVSNVQVQGAIVILSHAPVNPREPHRVSVKNVTDASLAQNPVAEGAGVGVGPDLTPPSVEGVRAASIVEVNPSSLPGDPESGEVVVVTFSERLDRISAENIENYEIEGLDVFAAYQRGRDVLLLTSQQKRNEAYALRVGNVFDAAGNVASSRANYDFTGLSLAKITFRAVVDFAWRSIDGSERGLPPGEGLYVTGTVLKEARALNGADQRVAGRTDIAGVSGFELLPSEEEVEGAPVYELTLRLPAGSYAFKFAHGTVADSINPPATLETVTKNLATRNDASGVTVDPRTGLGKDGKSYAGARLSLTGQDVPGQGVLFKRENPDEVLIVGQADRVLPIRIVGTWRDVPFGSGRDYDDGLVELPMLEAGVDDETAPKVLGVRARDSESVLVSFDEAVFPAASGIVARLNSEAAELEVVGTFVGQPLPNQLVVQTTTMDVDMAHTLLIGGVQDALGNEMNSPVTAGFTSPAQVTPFTPLVDENPPTVLSVIPSAPDKIEVTFSERVASSSVALENFVLSHASGGTAPTLQGVRLEGGNIRAVLTTTEQERQASYRLQVVDIEDIAGNAMEETQISFTGFGEFEPPQIEWVRAVTPTRIAVKWNENVTADTAGSLSKYSLSGGSLNGVQFSASDELRSASFNPTWAPLAADLVVLRVSGLSGGQTYTLRAEGVEDLSGNLSDAEVTFEAVPSAPTVDVYVSYLVSDTAGVVGVGAGGASASPARSLSGATLDQQREGLFVVGTALTEDGAEPISNHAFTSALGGFPDDGAPLIGVEAQMTDDGMGGDLVAGDRVYTLRIQDVPLGSTLSWKAFAPFTTTFGQANPQVPGAAFADAELGPSVFSDGQEYPGNDNAVYLVADLDGDGQIWIENLFGDEITYKRTTGLPAFQYVVDRSRRRE